MAIESARVKVHEKSHELTIWLSAEEPLRYNWRYYESFTLLIGDWTRKEARETTSAPRKLCWEHQMESSSELVVSSTESETTRKPALYAVKIKLLYTKFVLQTLIHPKERCQRAPLNWSGTKFAWVILSQRLT